MAYEIHKFAGMMDAVVAADRALEANRARDASHRRFLKGQISGKIAIRTIKRMTRASQKGKRVTGLFLRPFRGQTSDVFDRKC